MNDQYGLLSINTYYFLSYVVIICFIVALTSISCRKVVAFHWWLFLWDRIEGSLKDSCPFSQPSTLIIFLDSKLIIVVFFCFFTTSLKNLLLNLLKINIAISNDLKQLWCNHKKSIISNWVLPCVANFFLLCCNELICRYKGNQLHGK